MSGQFNNCLIRVVSAPTRTIISTYATNHMTTTFADYCATADAREQIAANVLEWTQMLCLALEQDFVQTSIKRARFLMPSSDNPQYWEDRIAEYKEGKDVYKLALILVASITRSSRHAAMVVRVFMHLLTRRLVNCTRQHHGKHLQRCSL